LQGHRNYAADPEWDRAVAMAAGFDPSDPLVRLPGIS
jgi:hypothetical protein